ncbi:exported hypothetical protein [Magnetospirillum sp. LM-5]|uniref:hypothetical protein n=1 Tax=Magnetospirillum sp. LM-5 TaxID=2681466 RepID=UPI00137D81B1|nr:hypothetical protein [Magnetospirillum sp. LM-5]CAA7611626.1 exported hypothetical protein [Magnetospirillum sp. LM-5]
MHPYLIMMIAVFLALTSSARADIAIGAGGTSLSLTGRVGAEDHCHAALALRANPAVTLVRIDSAGGNAWAGAQLARLFARAGLAVEVPRGARALSAAGVAALGGARLTLGGVLGLHGPYSQASSTAGLGEARAEMRAVLLESGLRAGQVDLALAQPRDRLLILGPADLADRRRHHRVDRAAVARIADACDSLFALMGRPSAGRQGHAETGAAVGQVGHLKGAGMVADNAVADP